MANKETKVSGTRTAKTSAALSAVALSVIQTKWANISPAALPVYIALLPLGITAVVIVLDWCAAVLGVKNPNVIVAEKNNKAGIEALKKHIETFKEDGIEGVEDLEKRLKEMVIAQTKIAELK